MTLWKMAGPVHLRTRDTYRYRHHMATALRVYVAAGIFGCCVFGGLMVWADNRNLEPLRTVTNYLTLLCLPALLIGGAVIAIGSIGL